jgi:hypothetical protein
MWPWKLKLDDKKSRHASLAQQNDFGVTILHNFANANKRHNKA